MGEKPSGRTIFLAVLALLAVTVAVFVPAMKADFTNWDDQRFVVDNRMIRSLSLENIKSMFAGFEYEPLFIPLVWLSYAIEYAFAGLNATVFHTVNVVMHLVNVFLVLLLMQRLSKNFFVSFITATLFAIHPMHVESVAWISERKDVLSTIFMLLSLLCYVSYISKNRSTYYVASLVAFLFGVLSKPMVVTVPVLLILFDYFFGEKVFSRRRLIEKVPYFCIGLFIGIYTIMLQARGGTVHEVFSTASVVTALDNIVFYISKLFVPKHLSAMYPAPDVQELLSASSLLLLFNFIIIVGAGVYLSLGWTKKIFFGFLFFIITILPVVHFIPVGIQNRADKFTYVPYIGFFMIIGVGVDYLLKKVKVPPARLVVSVVLALAVCSAAVLSFMRCGVWASSVTLWEDAERTYPDHPFIVNSRAHAYIMEAKTAETSEERELLLAMAEPLLRKAISLDEDYTDAYHNLGTVARLRGKNEQAKDYYEKCIEIDPRYALAYVTLASLLHQEGNFVRAIRCYETYIDEYQKRFQKDPPNEIYVNLGAAYLDIGNYSKAIDTLKKAIMINPKNTAAHFNLGNAYLKLRTYDKALDEFEAVIAIEPESFDALLNIGVIHLNRAELDEALSFFEQALEIRPDNLMAHWNIARTLRQKGDYAKALEELRKVLALNPPELVQKEVQAEIEILQKEVKGTKTLD